MNSTAMFQLYADRAKAAACPTCRTVNMLGMMCAAAVDNGGFLPLSGEATAATGRTPAMASRHAAMTSPQAI